MMAENTARPSDDLVGAPETADAPEPSEQARIAELVETLAREAAENKDKHLRTLAEMENLRRRTERDVGDARQYAIASFARDVVAVADNMGRALAAVDAEVRASADPGAQALIEGVELTERELLKALEKNGVQKFEPLGQKFDPHLHQAMFEVPDPSLPAGSVARVMQPGYMIGDRVLRPALVGVAKGGPKAGAAAGADNDNADAAPEPDGAD
jgi:molecular chaperone GrpE